MDLDQLNAELIRLVAESEKASIKYEHCLHAQKAARDACMRLDGAITHLRAMIASAEGGD